MPAMTSSNRLFAGGASHDCFQQAVTAALATLAALEGSPGPAAALARRTGGLLLIDDFTLVGLAGKYAGRSGATRLLHPHN